MKSDFYIGYLPRMPESIKRAVRVFVALALIAGIGLAFLFAAGQQPFANSVFEFGNVKSFTGTVQAKPVPFLLVEKEQDIDGLPTFFRYPLVGEGKRGVGTAVVELDGQKVNLDGTLVYRDGLRLIEVVAGSVKIDSKEPRKPESDPSSPVVPGATAKSLGNMTLRGEIIDSKCYLGVMNPGNKKAHRDCAVACLRGGIPALFLVKDKKGNKSELWLLSDTGQPLNDRILDYVAEPVEFRGRVTRDGDQLFFFVSMASLKRL